MSYRKQLLQLLVALVASASTSAPCAADGQLVVRVVDAAGQLTPVRAWVSSGGRHYFEPGAPDTATPYARDQSFSCDGTFTIDIPVFIQQPGATPQHFA